MRSIAILAACAAMAAGTVPMVVQAQTTTETVKADTKTMWEKIKGSWSQTKGTVKEQWGKLTDDDLLQIEGRRDQLVGKIPDPLRASRTSRPRPRSALGSRSAPATCNGRDTQKPATRSGPVLLSKAGGPARFALGPFAATLPASERGVKYA